MKNLSLIVNAVLLLAVAYLFFDKFSGPKKPAAPSQEQPSDPAVPGKPLSIVFVDIDSLHENSVAYQAIIKEMEKKATNVRASLAAKEKAFEKEYMEAAQKAESGTITPKQEMEYQESLKKKQDAIMSLREKASKEMDEEQTKFNDKFIGDIQNITDSLRTANGYDYVLYKGGLASAILSAGVQNDITKVVVDLLNAKK
ncbi:MAG: OmpH family outer membrane protein [Saprospiraceae bacterium]|nr:OmpH family outer membrane protein [Saprospiraceae bacterium]